METSSVTTRARPAAAHIYEPPDGMPEEMIPVVGGVGVALFFAFLLIHVGVVLFLAYLVLLASWGLCRIAIGNRNWWDRKQLLKRRRQVVMPMAAFVCLGLIAFDLRVYMAIRPIAVAYSDTSSLRDPRAENLAKRDKALKSLNARCLVGWYWVRSGGEFQPRIYRAVYIPWRYN